MKFPLYLIVIAQYPMILLFNFHFKIPKKQQSINLNVDILKQASNNAYDEHEKFIKTFDPRWRSDENIILIMCAIALFTPERPRVVHKEVIKLEQVRYILESYYYSMMKDSTYPMVSTYRKFLNKQNRVKF